MFNQTKSLRAELKKSHAVREHGRCLIKARAGLFFVTGGINMPLSRTEPPESSLTEA